MDRDTRRLTDIHQSRTDGVGIPRRGPKRLAPIVRRYAAHVVMHCGQHGHWFTGRVDSRENSRRLRDPRQALMDQCGWQVFEVQVKIILAWTASPAFPYLDGHCSADYVS